MIGHMYSCVFRLPATAGSEYFPARFDHSDYGSNVASRGWDAAITLLNEEEQNDVGSLSHAEPHVPPCSHS
jgi:hypothetical protein